MTVMATGERRMPHGWWILPSFILGCAVWGFAIYGAVQFFSHGVAS